MTPHFAVFNANDILPNDMFIGIYRMPGCCALEQTVASKLECVALVWSDSDTIRIVGVRLQSIELSVVAKEKRHARWVRQASEFFIKEVEP
jgi:hypothetical protein